MQKKVIPILIACLFLLSGCGSSVFSGRPVATADPYAGMVQVESGYGTKVGVKKYDDVPVNPLREADLEGQTEAVDENGVIYDLEIGIDVSEHQQEIDWETVAEDPPAFVIVRAGYRGYGEAGRLLEDACFSVNMDGALSHGIPVGVYFFSQAVSVEEAEEEAEFLLSLLRDYPPEVLRLPVFFDWEDISFDAARTDGLDGETLTDCAEAFCGKLAGAGYTAGVYTYRTLAYYRYDLSRISKYPLWIGALGNCPDFYYALDIWQCSIEGEVPGIEVPVDLDVIFVPRTEAG